MTSGLTRISHHAEAERHIKEAGCHTRSDSVRVVEALVTASSEFFHGKKKSEIRAYFQEAMTFLQQNQDPKTIISAVVHMDKKTPHMHLSFVPLTAEVDSAPRRSWETRKADPVAGQVPGTIVRKYPDLECGESANQTGCDHILSEVFKEMTHLTSKSQAGGTADRYWIL